MKPLSIFLLSSFVIALALFLFPINLFDGEIVVQHGFKEVVDEAPLSLSYFIGMGYKESEMVDVKSFRLLPMGYVMAFVIIIGIPALISYRIHLGQLKKSEE